MVSSGDLFRGFETSASFVEAETGVEAALPYVKVPGSSTLHNDNAIGRGGRIRVLGSMSPRGEESLFVYCALIAHAVRNQVQSGKKSLLNQKPV